MDLEGVEKIKSVSPPTHNIQRLVDCVILMLEVRVELPVILEIVTNFHQFSFPKMKI